MLGEGREMLNNKACLGFCHLSWSLMRTASVSMHSRYNSKHITDYSTQVLLGIFLPKCRLSVCLSVNNGIYSLVLIILVPCASFTLLPKCCSSSDCLLHHYFKLPLFGFLGFQFPLFKMSKAF